MLLSAERLMRSGDLTRAEALLGALTSDPDMELRNEARFRLGRLYRMQGDYVAAARQFRAILNEQPQAGPARIELARVLALMDNQEGARAELRRVQALDLPPAVAQLVDRVSSALRGVAPHGGSFEIGVAPDSNINRATSAQTVDGFTGPFVLDEDARSRSGVGLAIYARGYLRVAPASEVPLLLEANFSGDLYAEDQFNDLSLNLTAGPEIRTGQLRFRPSLLVGRRWFGANRLYDRIGIQTDMRLPIDRVSGLQIYASLVDFYYRVDNRSGPAMSLRVAYERALSARLYSRIALGVSRRNAEADTESNRTLSAEALISRDFGLATVFVGGSAAHIRSDEPFDFFGARRDDEFTEAFAGATIRAIDIEGFSPVLRVRWSRNDSPITIFDFERVRGELGITRSF